MSAAFDWFDRAPVLDLLFLFIWCAAIAALIGYAAWTIHTERQYRKKRERLIELAGGEPPSVRSGRKPLSKTAAASTDSPYPGAASSPQDPFTADHSNRPRLGLTRRGR